MKTLSGRFERIMMAITFAESGEHETARKIMKEDENRLKDRPAVSLRPRKEFRAPARRR